MEAGADVNLAASDGSTPAGVAKVKRFTDVFDILQRNGAKVVLPPKGSRNSTIERVATMDRLTGWTSGY